MREYFCAYHSMLDATRKLSDAEVGRLFRGLLHYSATGEQPINLQGREEIVFDIFSQQIDREVEKYQAACERNKRNGATGGHSPRLGTTGGHSQQEEEKEKDKDKDKKEGGSICARARFTPPTADEVKSYAIERGYTGFNAELFLAYYESNGWKVGRNPMKDWKAAVRNWAARDKEQPKGRSADWHNPALDYAQRDYTGTQPKPKRKILNMVTGEWEEIP